MRCVCTLLGWRAWSAGFNTNGLINIDVQYCAVVYGMFMCTCSSFPFHQKDNTTRKNKMHVFVCECVFSSFDTEGFASALRKYKWLRFQHVHLRVGHSKIFQGSWSKPLTYLVALCASFRCISRLSALSSSKFYLTGPVLLQLAAALCPGFGNLMNVSIPEMLFWCWLCFNMFQLFFFCTTHSHYTHY